MSISSSSRVVPARSLHYLCRWSALAIMMALIAPQAHATTGYFSLAYGAKSMGLAGAVVANPQDSLAAAANPAGMSLVGPRIDAGLLFFSPSRSGELDPRVVGGSFLVDDTSDRNLFLIPSFGYTRRINNSLWGGVSIYGNGGMNTSYHRNIYDETSAVLGAFQVGGAPAAASVPEGTKTGMPDTGTLGVDLSQLIIAPSLTKEIQKDHWLGASLLIGIQRFAARGFGNFQCFTQTAAAANPAACSPGGAGPLTPGFVPSNYLTDNGYDMSYGLGVRVGWIGSLNDKVTLGATVASKIYMSKFDKYKELFAEGGNFDIPANYALGIAVDTTPDLKISFDYQRILHGDIKAISNPGPVPSATGPSLPPGTGLLGTDNGLGYGWQDIDVYRLGAAYTYNKQWTLRAGLAYNDNPIPDDQLLFNITAPGVVKRHLTVGFTYKPGDAHELNAAYMHAFKERQETNTTALGVPGANEMSQDAIDLSYSWLFR
jgi:long-chain fatty acid transport protein